MGLKSSNPSTGGKGSYCCKIRWNFAALSTPIEVARELWEEILLGKDRARLRDEQDMARDAAMK